MASLESSIEPSTHCSAAMSCGGWRSNSGAGAATSLAGSLIATSGPPPSFEHTFYQRDLTIFRSGQARQCRGRLPNPPVDEPGEDLGTTPVHAVHSLRTTLW